MKPFVEDNSEIRSPDNFIIAISKDLKSFYSTLIFGSSIFLIVNFLVAYRFTFENSPIFGAKFNLIFFGISMFTLAFTVIAPLKAIKRFKSIVIQVKVFPDVITITTFGNEQVVISKTFEFKYEIDSIKINGYKYQVYNLKVEDRQLNLISGIFSDPSMVEKLFINIDST